MIDLTDTTRENGCLRVIPGSHRHDHPLHHLEAAHSAELQGFLNPDNPAFAAHPDEVAVPVRSEEHTSELQSLMRISYAVFCLKKKKTKKKKEHPSDHQYVHAIHTTISSIT